jgi:hypothetical protein
MSAWRIARYAAGAVLIVLFVTFAMGCLLNATAITEVRMRLKPGAEEPGDHHLLGIGDQDKLPDYRLSIRTKDGWEQVGTRMNTSAAGWMSFPIVNGLPARRALELQLVEDDKLENDVLEQLPMIGTAFSGKRFDFTIATKQSIESGMEWFFDTPVGKAISLGITIAVVVLILAIVGPIWPT